MRNKSIKFLKKQDKRNARIRELKDKGDTVKVIARKLKLCTRTVHNVLGAMNVEHRFSIDLIVTARSKEQALAMLNKRLDVDYISIN